MTRKKSNVKALALAVTCAILAGGYSSVSPVYAADVNVTGGTITVPAGDIGGTVDKTYNVTGITASISDDSIVNALRGKDIFASSITASSAGFNGLTIQTTPGGNSITLHEGAITATGNVTAGQFIIGAQSITEAKIAGYDSVVTAVNDANSGLAKKASQADVEALQTIVGTTADEGLQGKVKSNTTDISNLKTTIGDDSTGLKKDINDLKHNTTAISYDDASTPSNPVTKINTKTIIDGEIQAKELTLSEASASGGGTSASLNIEKLGKLSQLVEYTSGDKTVINAADGSTVGGVTFNNGAVSGVQSINGSNDKFNVDNNGKLTAGNIVSKGYIKAGSSVEIGLDGSTYGVTINKDGIYAGAANYDNAKAAIGTNGTLKAGNGNFNVDAEGKLFGTDSNKKISVDQLITDSTNVGGITRTGDATSGYTTKIENKVTVDGNGKIGGVSSINDKITITDNKVTIAVGTDNPVEITAEGLKVGTGSAYIADDGFKVGTDGHNTLTAEGLKAKTIKAGANNNEFVVDADGVATSKGGFVVKPGTEEKFKVDENGNITSKGTLNIIGKTVFGDVTGNNVSVDNGDLTATGALKGKTLGIGTSNTQFVVDDGGNITTAGGKAKFGSDAANVSLDAGDLTATGAVNGATMNIGPGNLQVLASGETIFGATAADQTVINKGTITANKALKVNDNNQLTTDGLKADKAVIDSISIDGAKITSSATSGALTIADVTVNDNGELSGVKAIDGVSVIANNATTGVTGGLKIGDNAIIGAPNTPFSSNGYDVDKDGNVEGKSFAVKGSTNNTKLEDGSLTIGTGNTWTQGTGINATSAKIASLEVTTSAKFGGYSANQSVFDDKGILTATGEAGRSTVAGKVTTINGGVITTDTLNVKRIELGENIVDKNGTSISGSKLTVDANGSLKAASGAFTVDEIGQVTNKIDVTDASETIFSTSKTGINATYRKGTGTETSGLTIGDNHAALKASGGAALELKDKIAKLGIGADSLTTYTEDTIESKVGTNVTRTMTTNTTKSIKDKVGEASREITENRIVDSVAGKTITTNEYGTKFGITGSTDNTLINGSTITSTKGSATGVLDGSTLTLTNGSAKTTLNAGSVTFESDNAGVYGGKTTKIDGGVISTDTLNVKRINLGGDIIDEANKAYDPNDPNATNNSKLYMDDEGNFRAATGNFTVKGGDGNDRGAMHNKVGNTTFDTTEAGASMSYDNSAAAGGVKSNVSVGDSNAKMSITDSTGNEKASVSTSDDNGGTTTIKGGTQTVTTDKNGTVFENTDHNTPFGSGSQTTTIINGNEITTGRITTDELVITGKGDATGDGSGTIALGGDGSIKSDINDGTNHTTFKTEATGTTTTVKDGTYTATNEVKANKIGSVITGGTVEISQELNAETGKITNAAGATSTELSNDGFTVKQNGSTDVNIAKGDVSVTNTQTGKQVNLSDLGSLGDLNEEITSREEYTSNKTAVGAINAEAGIRREEVARLDGRINDVNDRVNKVGAMAAAIASLKSIGYDPQAPSEFSIGLGQYKGETGVAMGFFHYPNKNFMINVSLSTAGGETMGGIGATWRFGHKSPQKLLDEQRAAQAKKELAAAEKYQAAAKLAKEAQERAEYAAKLARQAQVSADNAKAAADATQAKHF